MVTSRKPKTRSRAEQILAVDVGGTGLKAAVIDATGHMLTERVRVATPHPCTPDQLVDTLVALVAPIVAQYPPTQISIGFPGFVRDNRILTAPHFGVTGWHGANDCIGVGVMDRDDAIGVDLATRYAHRLVADLD